MDYWTDYVFPQLVNIAKSDALHQSLLSRCRELEADYIQITENLPPHQREMIDFYLAACEDADYRMIQLAYQYGRSPLSKNNDL